MIIIYFTDQDSFKKIDSKNETFFRKTLKTCEFIKQNNLKFFFQSQAYQ